MSCFEGEADRSKGNAFLPPCSAQPPTPMWGTIPLRAHTCSPSETLLFRFDFSFLNSSLFSFPFPSSVSQRGRPSDSGRMLGFPVSSGRRESSTWLSLLFTLQHVSRGKRTENQEYSNCCECQKLEGTSRVTEFSLLLLQVTLVTGARLHPHPLPCRNRTDSTGCALSDTLFRFLFTDITTVPHAPTYLQYLLSF